jgi:hypothetical protein
MMHRFTPLVISWNDLSVNFGVHQELTPERVPFESAMTQNNVGAALSTIRDARVEQRASTTR